MTMLGSAQHQRTPSGMKVAPMSYLKLEEVAEGLRPLLPVTRKSNSSRWNIDSQRVLEQTLPRHGYNYYFEEVSKLKEVAAFAVPDRGLVVLREDIYEGLFRDEVFSRSTVIHELCHIVLRHATTLHRGAVLGQHQFYEDSEWQAKALTASIMMPLAACQVAMNKQHLAEMCGTSETAAGFRIDQLIKQGRLDANRFTGQLFSPV